MNFLRKHVPEIIVLVYAIFFLLTKNPSSEWDRVIASDGKGYYGYLTALFIYQDLDYQFINQYEAEYYPASKQLYKDFRYNTGHGTVNKYFPGLSILWIPFFVSAHVVAHIFGFPVDGYSSPYQWFIALAALFYFWLSLLLLRRILRFYTKSENSISLVLITTALATNLIYYTVNAGCQVHVYNFFLINAFLYSILLALSKNKPIYYATAAFMLGMIIITRPQNALIVFSLPFICGNYKSFVSFIKSIFCRIRIFLPSLVAISIPLLIPVTYWYVTSGELVVYSYGNEKYDLTKPHLFSFLFSFEKGWLLYTPIAAFSSLGLVALFKKSKWQFMSLVIFLFFIVYFLSSWWVWNYTSYISQRVMIDYYSFIAILLIFVFIWAEENKKSIFLTVILFGFISINIMQYFQQLNWIYPAGPVTARAYFENFFQFSRGTTFMIPEKEVITTNSFSNDFETNNPDFLSSDYSYSTNGYESKRSLELTSISTNKTLFITKLDKYKDNGPVIIKVGAWINPQSIDSTLIITVGVGTMKLVYSSTQHNLLSGLKSGKWRYAEMVSYLPYIRSISDSLFVSFSNLTPGKVLVDDLKVEFLKVNNSTHHDWILAPDDKIESSLLFATDLETKPDSSFSNTTTVVSEKAYSGKKSSVITQASPYSVVFEKDLTFFEKDDGYIRVASQFNGEKDSEVLLVFDFSSDGKTVFYKTYHILLSETNIKWIQNEIFRELPADRYKAKKIKIYYWYVNGLNPVYIDDIHVDFVKYKKAEMPFISKLPFDTNQMVLSSFCKDFEKENPSESGYLFETPYSYSGNYVNVINKKYPYSSSFYLPLKTMLNWRDTFIFINAKVNTDQYTSGVSLVADFKQNGKSFLYQPDYLHGKTLKGEWSNIDFGLKIPEGITSKDSVLVYFYLPESDEECWIDNFCVSLRMQKKLNTK